MVPSFTTYLKSLVVTTAIAIISLFLLQLILPDNLKMPRYLGIAGFYFLLSASFFFGLLYAAKANEKGFARYYMAASMIKLLLLIAVIILVTVFNKPFVIPFTINFFLCYIIYTVADVRFMRKQFGSTINGKG